MNEVKPKVKAVTPQEVQNHKNQNIPDFIIEAVNKLLLAEGTKITLDSIVSLALENQEDCTSDEIYANNWLDIEPIYEAVGWEVKFYRPIIGENFSPYFKFTASK